MNTERINDTTDVAQIIWWNKVDDNHYQARVVYRDGTEGHYDRLTKDGWDLIKGAEMMYEVESASVPNPTPVVERNINKYPQYTREEQIGAFRRMSDSILLCAWCRCYVNRATHERVFSLTEQEFEATRQTGESHGMCKNCYQR